MTEHPLIWIGFSLLTTVPTSMTTFFTAGPDQLEQGSPANDTRHRCRRAFSQELCALAEEFRDRPATLAGIFAATQGSGFDLLPLLIPLTNAFLL